MNLYIVYDEAQYEVNSWFAEKLLSYAKEYFNAKLLICEKLTFGTKDGKRTLNYEGVEIENPDVVVMRSIFPLLSEFFEKVGARVYNNSKISEISNDKRKTYELVSGHDIQILDTLYFDRRFFETKSMHFEYPVILKSSSGHGGKEVFLVNNKKELEDIVLNLKNNEFLVQKLAPTLGKDVRVYVLGGKILSAVLRSSDTFKSNFSLGGKAEPFNLTKEQEKTVLKIIDLLPVKPDFVGIDFLPTEDGFYFNEIEDVVGTRMLYSCFNLDAAKIFIEYIKENELLK